MKKLFVCMFTLTLACSTMLFAAEAPRVAHATNVIVGHQRTEPDTSVTLCNTLGPKTNEYILSGYYVAGPASSLGTSQFIASPCTPKATHTLTTVKAGWQWAGSGANEIQVCLYSDSGSNTPGTQIGNCVTKTNLPNFGTTNTLVTANFKSQNLSLTGGTQYWIVAQTPGSGTGDDALDVWCGTVAPYTGSNVGSSGWYSFEADYTPSMRVSGQ